MPHKKVNVPKVQPYLSKKNPGSDLLMNTSSPQLGESSQFVLYEEAQHPASFARIDRASTELTLVSESELTVRDASGADARRARPPPAGSPHKQSTAHSAVYVPPWHPYGSKNHPPSDSLIRNDASGHETS